jgi:hypothetical protein
MHSAQSDWLRVLHEMTRFEALTADIACLAFIGDEAIVANRPGKYLAGRTQVRGACRQRGIGAFTPRHPGPGLDVVSHWKKQFNRSRNADDCGSTRFHTGQVLCAAEDGRGANVLAASGEAKVAVMGHRAPRPIPSYGI